VKALRCCPSGSFGVRRWLSRSRAVRPSGQPGGSSGASVRHLRVSAATISHAVTLLHQHELIRRGRDSHSRRHRYFFDENAGVRSAVAGVRANQQLAATVLRGADIFGADTAVGTRLAASGQFLEDLGNDILRAVERRAHAIPAAGTKRPRTPRTTTR
jgi:hypothetical protein